MPPTKDESAASRDAAARIDHMLHAAELSSELQRAEASRSTEEHQHPLAEMACRAAVGRLARAPTAQPAARVHNQNRPLWYSSAVERPAAAAARQRRALPPPPEEEEPPMPHAVAESYAAGWRLSSGRGLAGASAGTPAAPPQLPLAPERSGFQHPVELRRSATEPWQGVGPTSET